MRGGDPARTFEAPGFFLAQRDVGAFGEPGLLVTHAAATAVAGDPLPEPAPGGPPSRLSDLERLAPAMTTSIVLGMVFRNHERVWRVLMILLALGVTTLYFVFADALM